MKFSNEDEIKATLLYHLRRKKMIGGVHTPFDTLRRGFPAHIGKEVLKSAKELIKQRLLLTKPTSYGLEVSLNIEKIDEIEEFIKKILGVEF